MILNEKVVKNKVVEILLSNHEFIRWRENKLCAKLKYYFRTINNVTL